jgi:hypothetical protein
MGKDWIVELANFFEELRILKVSKQEALKSFSQFCEFVVEPAFENLEDELAQYGIKSKIIKIKNKSIAFQINFRKSKIGHFKYIILLPQGALNLRLKLKLRSRKTKRSDAEEKEVRFMKEIDPNHILDLDKEEVIQDVIKKYRDFIYESEAVME